MEVFVILEKDNYICDVFDTLDNCIKSIKMTYENVLAVKLDIKEVTDKKTIVTVTKPSNDQDIFVIHKKWVQKRPDHL